MWNVVDEEGMVAGEYADYNDALAAAKGLTDEYLEDWQMGMVDEPTVFYVVSPV